MLKIKILILFLLITVSNYSQNNRNSNFYLENFFREIQLLNINKAKRNIDEIQDLKVKNRIRVYFDLIKNNGFQYHSSDDFIEKIHIDKISKPDLTQLLDLLILSEDAIQYKNDRILSFDLAYEGYKKSETLKNQLLQTEFILKILKIYKLGIINNDVNVNSYINKLLDLNTNNEIYSYKAYFYKIYLNEMGVLRDISKNDKKYKRLISNEAIENLEFLYKEIRDKKNLSIEYFHLKALSELPKKNIKKSLDYLEKERKILDNKKGIFFNKLKYENLKETARILNLEKKYKEAKDRLEESRKFESKLNKNRNDFVFNLYVSDIYNGLNIKDSAFASLKIAFQKSLLLNFENQNNLISSLEVKNKTVEKEKQILISEQKRKQILRGFILLIVFGGTTTYLTLKNSKKKRLLAEQQKELEKQKNINLIKEQEITTINAMLEGQEKERTRIAEDLHDNIGSVLATLKLHFENLKLNREKKHFNQEELYSKTEDLIDETYKKVRSLAHSKNAGVIANQGLLVAIKIMAEKITSANKTKIEVLDFGLDKRIDNNLELSVFRIVQELVTNIIKHAKAEQATINLSLFESTLNIIIEDNGKGFNYKKIQSKKGMGLSSIQTRIEHLKGDFTVDSTLNKGTSIIMNIPII